MKKLTTIIMSIAIIITMVTSVLANNKYDFIKKEKEVVKLISDIEKVIVEVPLLSDFFNEIIDDPILLYRVLDEYECNPELLKFCEQNKEFVWKIFRGKIIQFVIRYATENDPELLEFRLVVGYIKSPTHIAATNAYEAGIESSIFRQSAYFNIYEKLRNPVDMADIVESIFNEYLQ